MARQTTSSSKNWSLSNVRASGDSTSSAYGSASVSVTPSAANSFGLSLHFSGSGSGKSEEVTYYGETYTITYGSIGIRGEGQVPFDRYITMSTPSSDGPYS